MYFIPMTNPKNGKMLYLALTTAVLFTVACTNSIPPEKKKELQGRWVEIYQCDNVNCNYPKDTAHTSVITFDGNSFTTEFYNDSGQNAKLDTTFSGTYWLSQDTLELILKNFNEVFFYRIADNYLYLTSAYTIDSKGNIIIDFRSVLWCCDMKKNGRFEKS
jgi:hypothetical protein